RISPPWCSGVVVRGVVVVRRLVRGFSHAPKHLKTTQYAFFLHPLIPIQNETNITYSPLPFPTLEAGDFRPSPFSPIFRRPLPLLPKRSLA
ncbi:hypothetical protein S245_053318, partial [Arachis hypogaea]